jgi:hypothetical protein
MTNNHSKSHTVCILIYEREAMSTMISKHTLLKCTATGVALLAVTQPVQASQLFDDWVPVCAALAIDTEKLACFMQMSKEFKAKDPSKWNGELQNKLTAQVTKQVDLDAIEAANEATHAKDRLFLRGSTDVGKLDDKPAQIALTRADNQSSGLIRAALVYMNKQKLTHDGDERYYIGLGIHRDDSKPTALVHTSDIRLGYEKVFQFRKKDTPGIEQRSWLSVTRLNRLASDERSYQLDLGYRASRRWFEQDRLDRVSFDRLAAIKLNPFLDHTRSNTTGVTTRTQGIGLGLDFSWYRPTAVNWLPGGDSQYVPDHLVASTLRNVGLGSTPQYSTINKLGLVWDFARNPSNRTQSSLSLTREVGANFRDDISQSAKTLLTLDVKFN